MDVEPAHQQVDWSWRRALRSAEHAAATAAVWWCDGAARGWGRTGRRRWSADGGDGGRQLALSPRPLYQRAEPVQPHELQRLRRQPTLTIFWHRNFGRSSS